MTGSVIDVDADSTLEKALLKQKSWPDRCVGLFFVVRCELTFRALLAINLESQNRSLANQVTPRRLC